MIYQELQEPVVVRADFQAGRVTPLAFRRKGRLHTVVQVAARWEDRRAGDRVLFFSCLDGVGDLYQLRFEARDVGWHLDAVQLAADPLPGGAGRAAGRRRPSRKPPL